MQTFTYPVALGEESDKREDLPKGTVVDVSVTGFMPDQKEWDSPTAWEKAIAETKYNQTKNGRSTLAAPPRFGDVMFEGMKVKFRQYGMSVINENIRRANGSKSKKGKKAKWTLE